LREELIDGAEEAPGLIEGDGALAAEIGLQIGHEKSGGDALAGNIADDQAETVGAEVKKVVIVASHGACREAVTRVVEPVDRRANLRKKAALDFVGDFEFLRGAAFDFEFCGGGATLGFEGVRDFVEADQGENVAVNVAEARGDAAPDGGFLAEKGRFDRRADAAGFGIKLYPAEARSVIEADAAEGPLFVFRDDIFGDEDDLRGTADELVLDRIWLGGNEGKNGGAVGRSDGDEAFPGLKLDVIGEVEAELVEVEAEAAVEITDEDLGGMDTQVRGGIRGWCGGGHEGDYTAGAAMWHLGTRRNYLGLVQPLIV